MAHPVGFTRRPITLRNQIPEICIFLTGGCITLLQFEFQVRQHTKRLKRQASLLYRTLPASICTKYRLRIVSTKRTVEAFYFEWKAKMYVKYSMLSQSSLAHFSARDMTDA